MWGISSANAHFSHFSPTLCINTADIFGGRSQKVKLETSRSLRQVAALEVSMNAASKRSVLVGWLRNLWVPGGAGGPGLREDRQAIPGLGGGTAGEL